MLINVPVLIEPRRLVREECGRTGVCTGVVAQQRQPHREQFPQVAIRPRPRPAKRHCPHAAGRGHRHRLSNAPARRVPRHDAGIDAADIQQREAVVGKLFDGAGRFAAGAGTDATLVKPQQTPAPAQTVDAGIPERRSAAEAADAKQHRTRALVQTADDCAVARGEIEFRHGCKN